VTRTVPSLPRLSSDAVRVTETEEIVVGTHAMPAAEWRAAFATGYLLAALSNLQLLPTTLHVMQFALGVDPIAWVDALLATDTPRLAAVRDELHRFADATLHATGTALAVRGYGEARRDPTEGATARVVDDIEGYAGEAADVAAALFPSHAALLRDVIAWDAIGLPAPHATTDVRRFAWNWPAYASAQSTCPAPQPVPITVHRRAAPWAAATGAVYLDALLALGWSKAPRVSLVVEPSLTVPELSP
jgi:hypothetical protein